MSKESESFKNPNDDQGDPSRLEIHREESSIGPEGFRLGNPNNLVALGKEKDILAFLRQQGYSEEAIAAFKSGKPIIMTYQDTPFGRAKLNEDWSGKDKNDKV